MYVTVASDGTESYTINFTSSTRYIRLLMNTNIALGFAYSVKDGDLVLVTNNNTSLTYGPLKPVKNVGDYLYI